MLSETAQALLRDMAEFEIIDCHEHLGPERNRVAAQVDVFTLFAHYTRGDLAVAGMSDAQYQSLFNRDIPLARRWAVFEPFWEQIRWGSYARAALLAAQRFYGADDINARTFEAISEAMQQANTPGLYDRVLRQACNIRTCLTQCGSTDLGGTPLLTPVMPLAYEMETWQALSRPPFEPNAAVRSLDDTLDAVRRYVVRVKAEGAVGLKMMSNPYKDPKREEALSAFESLRSGAVSRLPVPNPLRDYVVDQAISAAADNDLVVCVHTGYWGDFRLLDPLHMIPILQRHPRARFDIYHVGYPWVREALMLGKGFPNVWLNFCWTHIISQKFAMDALDEAIDLIPMNKLLAFGGDYGVPVEKVYGHLVMAREDVARVLARRIADGQMTAAQALALARQWFVENPKALYRLKA
ncbi:MAG TPA: amidohydrolase family protein [Planctomycetota bacterium]|nr:amidohydrolase family protein [Planctomycetota bacterium]HRR79067.1 amidohydrolase family protein [Planctomycetota bacterium]HRT93017.1 amidohydrolase family protein [Planctomycetota bacterium]